jgi:hypothetical protein
LIPYAIFKKIIEPLFFSIYDGIISPIYKQSIKKFPLLKVIVSILLSLISKMINLVTWGIRWIWKEKIVEGAENHFLYVEKLGDDIGYL